MPRSYHFCPMCRRRMRLIGISPETFSQPPLPVERYYQCPNCEAEYTYNIEWNFIDPGVPPRFTETRRD